VAQKQGERKLPLIRIYSQKGIKMKLTRLTDTIIATVEFPPETEPWEAQRQAMLLVGDVLGRELPGEWLYHPPFSDSPPRSCAVSDDGRNYRVVLQAHVCYTRQDFGKEYLGEQLRGIK
jgi:hypothetical protein